MNTIKKIFELGENITQQKWRYDAWTRTIVPFDADNLGKYNIPGKPETHATICKFPKRTAKYAISHDELEANIQYISDSRNMEFYLKQCVQLLKKCHKVLDNANYALEYHSGDKEESAYNETGNLYGEIDEFLRKEGIDVE